MKGNLLQAEIAYDFFSAFCASEHMGHGFRERGVQGMHVMACLHSVHIIFPITYCASN